MLVMIESETLPLICSSVLALVMLILMMNFETCLLLTSFLLPFNDEFVLRFLVVLFTSNFFLFVGFVSFP